MRKLLPAILIGVGAFLITMALLMRFYAVPKLAVVPLDQNSKQVVLGPDSTFLDVAELKIKTGTLQSVATVIGDPAASKEASKESGKDLAVWDKGQITQYLLPDGKGAMPPIDGSTDRVVFDRYTGEAVNCCGETANGKPMEHKGQLVKWPFFAQKKTYQYWDGTTSKAYPAEFKGEEEIMGLKVYRYEQDVPRTKTEEREVPAFLFGQADRPVTADRYYSNHRVFWIEPVTGVMIKLSEAQDQTLEIPNADPITAVKTTSVFSDATVKKNVDDYKSKSSQLALIKGPAPLGSAILGVLLLLAGLALGLLGARGRRAADGYDEDDADGTHDTSIFDTFEDDATRARANAEHEGTRTRRGLHEDNT